MSDTKHKYHCGSWWMPKWIKYILGLGGRNDICAWHDSRYAEQINPREVEDFEFFKKLFLRHKSFLKGLIDYCYFFLVFKYGQKSWDRNAEMRNK